MIISPGAVNGKVFIPAEDGIFDQHRASSIQHLYASSKKFDKRTQTRLFEALASLYFNGSEFVSVYTFSFPANPEPLNRERLPEFNAYR